MKKLSKQQRHKDYNNALLTFKNSTCRYKHLCLILNDTDYPELLDCFPIGMYVNKVLDDYSDYKDDCGVKNAVHIREIILLLCIEMTRP